MPRRSLMRWICLKPPEKLKDDERGLLERLLSGDSELALGYDLTQRFRLLMKERDLVAMDRWIGDASRSDIPAFMALANSIKTNWGTVEAAFLLPWSSGQLEGQVNRVKLIKRQGYGRAKLDLLRPRVLLGTTRTTGVRGDSEPNGWRIGVPSRLASSPLELVAA